MNKKLNIFPIALAILFASCIPTASDPTGTASFYVYNGHSQDLTIVAVTNHGLSSQTIEKNVKPLETIKFMDDSGIGVNPAPEISFSSLYAKNNVDTIIYSQDPINNQAWIKEVNNPKNADYYHTNYTLKILKD